MTKATQNPTTSTSLTSLISRALPSLSGSMVSYNKERNIFLSSGYTSAAGNTYYQGIRLSDRIIINYDLGQGYAYTFLNALKVYGFDGHEKKLIGYRTYSCNFFSEPMAKREVVSILKDYLQSQALMQGSKVEERMLSDFSEHLAEEAISQRHHLLR